jgi:hypothetical protein
MAKRAKSFKQRYAAAMRHSTVMMQVHYDGVVAGEAPNEVRTKDGIAVLEWLAAERIHREDNPND